MAGTAITRSFLISINNPSSFSFYLCKRFITTSLLNLNFSPLSSSTPTTFPSSLTLTKSSNISFPALSLKPSFQSSLCTSSSLPSNPPKRNTKVNFSVDSDSDSDTEDTKKLAKPIDKSKLPPPYDPFNKKPAIQLPDDPTNLQEVFHNLRTDGLMNSAVKMLDGLSKDGLTHESLELFSIIKNKGNMPDVVAYTAVIEAYADAGQAKEAHKVYMRMLASGVLPNAYTYTVLIKGLASSGDVKLLKEAKKYIVEMMGKGMKPNAGTYVAVFEALVKEEKMEEAREFLEELKSKGFDPNERAVKEAMKDRRGGSVFRSVMRILFGKW